VRQCVQGGPLWNGATLGLPDCVLLPYAYRLYVLEHYRGADFRVPQEGAGGLWEKYTEWLETACALDCVAHTLPNKERYLAHVAKYAEGKARSKVGNAVRRGVAAHR
jgi:glutathione S-transferase